MPSLSPSIFPLVRQLDATSQGQWHSSPTQQHTNHQWLGNASSFHYVMCQQGQQMIAFLPRNKPIESLSIWHHGGGVGCVAAFCFDSSRCCAFAVIRSLPTSAYSTSKQYLSFLLLLLQLFLFGRSMVIVFQLCPGMLRCCIGIDSVNAISCVRLVIDCHVCVSAVVNREECLMLVRVSSYLLVSELNPELGRKIYHHRHVRHQQNTSGWIWIPRNSRKRVLGAAHSLVSCVSLLCRSSRSWSRNLEEEEDYNGTSTTHSPSTSIMLPDHIISALSLPALALAAPYCTECKPNKVIAKFMRE